MQGRPHGDAADLFTAATLPCGMNAAWLLSLPRAFKLSAVRAYDAAEL